MDRFCCLQSESAMLNFFLTPLLLQDPGTARIGDSAWVWGQSKELVITRITRNSFKGGGSSGSKNNTLWRRSRFSYGFHKTPKRLIATTRFPTWSATKPGGHHHLQQHALREQRFGGRSNDGRMGWWLSKSDMDLQHSICNVFPCMLLNVMWNIDVQKTSMYRVRPFFVKMW